MNLSLKKRKPIVYISMGIYLLLSSLILVESALPGDKSGARSHFMSDIIAWIVNIFSPTTAPKTINPSEITSITDTSYLGKDEYGNSNIAIGTTTLLSLQVEYPNKSSNDVYNYSFNYEGVKGDVDDYTVNLSSSTSNNILNIYLRVTANEISNELYQIDINIADKLTYNFKFNIVDLPAPSEYECRVDKTTIKIGESLKVQTKLIGNDKSDTYLRRYFDESRLLKVSSNPLVADFDEYGVLHGISQGTVEIVYGNKHFDITVSDEVASKPVDNELVLSTLDSSSYPSLLDYDYVFDNEDDPNDYSVLIYGDFLNNTLEDKSLSYIVDDPLKVKLAPHHYDSDGYPIYKDDYNKECVRVCGYRKKGDVTLTVISNGDSSLTKTMTLNVGEALPTSMTVNVNESESIYVNETKIITASFNPKNVSDRRLHIEVSNPSIVDIKNNDNSSVVLTGKSVGTVKVTVKSVANNSLTYEFNLEFKEIEKINPSNKDSFHKLIRKGLGHFLLFALTSIFGFIFFYTYLDDKKKLWLVILLSLFTGFFIAGLSELIQYFIPGRSGVFSDVLVDFLGYGAGTLITLAIILIIWLIKYLVIRNKKVDYEEQ